jgi:hypothetical protein
MSLNLKCHKYNIECFYVKECQNGVIACQKIQKENRNLSLGLNKDGNNNKQFIFNIQFLE